jgi:hypothetical protein
MFNRMNTWFGNLSGPKKVATVAVTIATGIGAILGAILAFMDLYDRFEARSTAANPLELVDVGFTQVKQKPTNLPLDACDGDECTVPAVDFKVTNVGEDPVIIERANIQVKRIWTFEAPYVPNPKNMCYGARLLPSFNYEAELPTRGAPYTLSASLSQSIAPNGTDRFTITPRRDERTAVLGQDYVFLFTISLIYGVENNATTSGNLIYGEMHPPASLQYAYRRTSECWAAKEGLDSQEVAKLTKRNKQTVTQIRHTEAPRNESLEELLQYVSGAR